MSQGNLSTADIPEAAAAGRHAGQPRLKTTALAVEELDEETLKALATSRMDPNHDRLDSLVD